MGQDSMQGCLLQISRALCVALFHPVVFLGLPALSQLRDTDELHLGSPSLCNGLETFLQEYVGGNVVYCVSGVIILHCLSSNVLRIIALYILTISPPQKIPSEMEVSVLPFSKKNPKKL